MINVKILLNKLVMPDEKTKRASRLPLEKRVEIWMDRVTDEEVGNKYWKKLKCVYETLAQKENRSKDEEKLLKKITPTIRKYMQYDNEGVETTTDHMSEG